MLAADRKVRRCAPKLVLFGERSSRRCAPCRFARWTKQAGYSRANAARVAGLGRIHFAQFTPFLEPHRALFHTAKVGLVAVSVPELAVSNSRIAFAFRVLFAYTLLVACFFLLTMRPETPRSHTAFMQPRKFLSSHLFQMVFAHSLDDVRRDVAYSRQILPWIATS